MSRPVRGERGAAVWLLAIATAIVSVLVTAAFAGAAPHPASPVAATVKLAGSKLGRILVDGRGVTLYLFEKDTGKASTCYGPCATLWPPLLTKKKPRALAGALASKLGTSARRDGKLQVTYNGHPLYYYVSDTEPGETSGQALDQYGAAWYVLSRAGTKIEGFVGYGS